MSSPTDVANDALVSHLGQAPISNIDDGSVNANRVKVAYGPLVDSVLRSHWWRCATFFTTLDEMLGWPQGNRWAHAFVLPRDPFCLRVKEVNQNRFADWTIGGNRLLLTNDPISTTTDGLTVFTCKLEYIGRLTDPTLWDAMLFQAVSAALASKLAIGILHDIKLSQQLYALSNQIGIDAMSVSGQEGSQEEIHSDELVQVRGDGRVTQFHIP